MEELKREEEMKQNSIIYDVYKTATGLYVAEDVCQMYNVGDPKDYKTLREKLCYRITDEDMETIERQSNYQGMKLIPNIVTIFDLQLVLSFTVYVDNSHNNKLYILNNLCSKYGIYPQSKRIIDGTTYCNVTEKDLDTIEEKTKAEKIVLKRKYVEISLEDEIKPAEYLFIYYYDYETRKCYIRRDMYDIFTKNGIQIEGNPKIINDKNCYSITEKELKDVELHMGYRGVEQLLKPRDIEFNKVENPTPVHDALASVMDIAPINQEVVEETTKVEVPQEDLVQQEETHYNSKEEEEELTYEKVVVYVDGRTGNAYIPTNLIEPNGSEPKIIMHKPCYEANIFELGKIHKKRLVVATIYPIEKKDYNILICNNNGQLYIAKDMLEELGFYIENPHRIMVNKEIYEEITEDDIELIQDKESDSCHINIIVKQITPKRG